MTISHFNKPGKYAVLQYVFARLRPPAPVRVDAHSARRSPVYQEQIDSKLDS
jgi:hypothetical protein